MASTILLRTISSIDDKRAVLANSQIARTLTIGNSWTKIRVGIRYSYLDPGANLTSTPRFVIGVCSGTSNIYGDSTTTNFIGAISDRSTWTYTAGTPPYFVNGGGSIYPVTRVGSTTTIDGSSLHALPQVALGADTGYRSLFAVEIEKGSPNYTVQDFQCGNFAAAEVSLLGFYSVMSLATLSLSGYSYGSAVAVAASEGPGDFDSVCVHWDRVSPALEISDIAVVKLS